jgi:uncharacterized protein YbjT (DUF2867 family)
VTVLVLGSRGQTGRAIAAGLIAGGASVRRADTAGAGDVRFVWEDPTTYAAALHDVRAVYLMAPPANAEPERLVEPLLEQALAAGVKRFVALSSSAIGPDDPGLGAVHRLLAARTPEWCVLRPSWFMQNFVDPRHMHAQSLAQGRPLRSATGSAGIAFIDTRDIAAVAVAALTRTDPHNADLILTGPEVWSYQEIAATIGARLGRAVRHQSLTPEELRAHLVQDGMPYAFASLLADLDRYISDGHEARTTSAVKDVTGHEPRTFANFVAEYLRPDPAA